MRILVIGSGGREHALVWSLAKSDRPELQLFCAPANDGIAQLAERIALDATDINALAQFASEQRIDFTIVGGEAPLAEGIVDLFESRGLVIAGAQLAAARLESSKAFAKDFMAKHRIPTARYRIAASADEALAILQSGEFGSEDAAVVIKADGLAGGKGVVVARSRAEGAAAIRELMIDGAVGAEAARRVVVEEALEGREVSLLLFSDGKVFALMPAARDHKRVGENDTGPNTGGMGVVTDPEVIDRETLQRVVDQIVEPTLEGARSDGFEFRGVLFIGLMLTTNGPQVLEYNVRFGDPEAQAILVRLKSDLVDIFEGMARECLATVPIEWTDDASACVVLAARGYPARPETGARIEGLERAALHPDVQIFHAGTTRDERDSWLTAGGRVLGVTATGKTLDQALRHCYDAVGEIRWDGMHYRRDIGKR